MEWNSTEKFDYDGEFYQPGTAGRVCGPTAEHRSTSVAPPPVHVSGKHADLYAFGASRWPESRNGSVSSATPHGR
jgi:hypothetical protein